MKKVIDWLEKSHIQDALLELSREECEFILSGITSDEWDKMFGL